MMRGFVPIVIMRNKPLDLHNLNFSDFKKMASDPSLSQWEKVGFPDEYRKGKEPLILTDIISKASNLNLKNKKILDIGCGCSDLTRLLHKHCVKHHHELHLIDSQEMLSVLGIYENVHLHAGEFPELPEFIQSNLNSFDVIIVYSVIQYPYALNKHFEFINAAIGLLRFHGQLLIGDIPNRDLRNRFLKTSEGQEFYRKLSGSSAAPAIEDAKEFEMTDAFTQECLKLYNNAQNKCVRMNQARELPFGNRREDLIIYKSSS